MNWSPVLRSRRRNALSLLAFVVAVLAVVVAPGKLDRGSAGLTTWKITWTNLTPIVPGNPAAGSSQPFTRPAIVTHDNKLTIWHEGQIANAGVAFLAMDPLPAPGSTAWSPLHSMLSTNKDVFQAVDGPGPTPSQQSNSATIQTSADFDRLDFLTMFAFSNDTFTGLTNYHVTGNATVYAYAYDAGTEWNNWDGRWIPGPCVGCSHQFAMAESGELIHRTNSVDLQGIPGYWAWDNSKPVLKITIEKTS